MPAYLTRMPAGIPGDVSRKEGATIESSLVGSKAIPYGAFVKLVSGKLEPLAASDTAAVIYGRIGLHIHGTGRRRRQHRNRLQHLGAHHVYF